MKKYDDVPHIKWYKVITLKITHLVGAVEGREIGCLDGRLDGWLIIFKKKDPFYPV